MEIPKDLHLRPEPWSVYTARTLWDDDHISQKMLEYHLDPNAVPASRPHAFIDRSADWITHRFSLGPGSKVADFGCGPGLYTERFARAGAEVTGVDFSRRSIAAARDRAHKAGLAIEYIHADYLADEISGPFDLITLIYCDFCALSPKQRRNLLGRFRNILANDGSLLLDVFTLAAFNAREEGADSGPGYMDEFWAPGSYTGYRNTFKYTDEAVVLDRYVIVEPHRTRTVYNWLQYFSMKGLDAELAANGMRIVETFGDVAGAPFNENNDIVAVIVEKKSP